MNSETVNDVVTGRYYLCFHLTFSLVRCTGRLAVGLLSEFLFSTLFSSSAISSSTDIISGFSVETMRRSKEFIYIPTWTFIIT